MKRRVTIAFPPTIQTNHNPYKCGLPPSGAYTSSYSPYSASCDLNGNVVTSAAQCCSCVHDKRANTAAAMATNDADWRCCAFIALVTVAIYMNGVHGEFVHDDIPAITMNKDVLGVTPITHVFRNDFWGTPMSDINSHKSYRPLTTLSFR